MAGHVAVLLVGVLSGTVSRCTGGAIEGERAKNAASEASQPKATPEALPDFKVVTVEDVSVGETPRFDCRVVVSGQPTPEQRKCPFYQVGGSSASACIKDKCAMWQDEAGACAFNVLAQAAVENRA